MILKKEQLEEIKNFSKNNISKNDDWHKEFHIKQTVKLAIALAKKEKADINKCIVIAWLHDIAKHKEKENLDHGIVGAKLAKSFLKKIGFKNEDIKDICHAIYQHNKDDTKTLEAKIIWDVDKLQAIGPYGLIRNYGYFVNKGYGQETAFQKNIEFQNFFIKRFRTKTGKKVARKNFKFMKKFYKKYQIIEQAKL